LAGHQAWQVKACVSQINSLLGSFEQQTGQKFGGSDAEYTILQKLVRFL